MVGRACVLVIWAGAAVVSGQVQAPAPNPNNSKSIKTFINCINDTLIVEQGATDISMTVGCVPSQVCFMTGTSSENSAQPACSVDIEVSGAAKKIEFPRILVDCPGPDANRRFRPSYSLCPKPNDQGKFASQRIEIGDDTGPVDVTKPDGGKMVMSDIPLPPREAMKFQKIDPNATYNMWIRDPSDASKRTDSKRCNACHEAMNDKAPLGTLALSGPVDNFSEADPSNNQDLAPLILFSDEPNRIANLPPERKPKNPLTFEEVCGGITTHKAAVKTKLQGTPNFKPEHIDTIEQVCRQLLAKKRP